MDTLFTNWPLLPIWLLGSVFVLALIDRAGTRRGTTTYGTTHGYDAMGARPALA